MSDKERGTLLELEGIASQATNQPYPIPTSLWGKQIAMAVYAAGYRKPRTITTVEELDALPDASVILSEQGGVWEHQWDDGGRYWVTPGNSDEVFTSDKLALPATVLHEPAA